jgi:tetratricopeptide (TPR) repeat protein
MKNIYLTFSFVIASGLLSAQNKDTKIADKLFDRYEYVDAVQEYLKLEQSGKADVYVYKQLADCYYAIFNTKAAIKWYAKAIAQKQDAETYYKYAQMLKSDGNYLESDKQMKQFAVLAPNDSRAKAFSNNLNYLPALKGQTKLFEVVKSDISSDKTDFGAVLTTDNSVYFSSARNTSRRNSNWEEPYLDLYKATYNANGTISEAVAISNLNTKWQEKPESERTHVKSPEQDNQKLESFFQSVESVVTCVKAVTQKESVNLEQFSWLQLSTISFKSC